MFEGNINSSYKDYTPKNSLLKNQIEKSHQDTEINSSDLFEGSHDRENIVINEDLQGGSLESFSLVGEKNSKGLNDSILSERFNSPNPFQQDQKVSPIREKKSLKSIRESQIYNLNPCISENQSQDESKLNKTKGKENYFSIDTKSESKGVSKNKIKQEETFLNDSRKVTIRSKVSRSKPILAEGSPSKYKDPYRERFNKIEDLSDIEEPEGINPETGEDIQEIKREAQELEQVTSNVEMRWLDFSEKIRENAAKCIFKEIYTELQKNPDFWNRSKYDSNTHSYHIHYCIIFIQHLSFLYKEALPTLIGMLEFYTKYIDSGTLDLGLKDLGILYLSLGTCYSNTGQEDTGLCYLKEGKKTFEQMPDKQPLFIAHSLSRLGQHFLRYKKFDTALEYFETALEITKQIDGTPKFGEPTKNFYMMWCYFDLSDIWIAKGNYEEADIFLQLGLEKMKVEKAENTYFLAKSKRNEAQICLHRNEIKKVLNLYQEALQILDETLPEGNQLKVEYQAELDLIMEDL